MAISKIKGRKNRIKCDGIKERYGKVFKNLVNATNEDGKERGISICKNGKVGDPFIGDEYSTNPNEISCEYFGHGKAIATFHSHPPLDDDLLKKGGFPARFSTNDVLAAWQKKMKWHCMGYKDKHLGINQVICAPLNKPVELYQLWELNKSPGLLSPQEKLEFKKDEADIIQKIMVGGCQFEV